MTGIRKVLAAVFVGLALTLSAAAPAAAAGRSGRPGGAGRTGRPGGAGRQAQTHGGR